MIFATLVSSRGYPRPRPMKKAARQGTASDSTGSRSPSPRSADRRARLWRPSRPRRCQRRGRTSRCADPAATWRRWWGWIPRDFFREKEVENQWFPLTNAGGTHIYPKVYRGETIKPIMVGY